MEKLMGQKVNTSMGLEDHFPKDKGIVDALTVSFHQF